MKLDPVLAEIRDVREAYSERFNGDVHAMLTDLKERQDVSGKRVVSRPAKRLPCDIESSAAAETRG